MDLPSGNRSTDREIAELADADDRVVVSKDRDFRDGHLLRGAPRRLLVVATGNITNADLLAVFDENIDLIVASLQAATYVELGPDSLVVHRETE